MPAANFIKETQIYPDGLDGQYSFLALTDRGGSDSGVLFEEDGKIIFEGFDTQRGLTFKFRISLEIMPDGSLHDYFYSLQGEEWVQGHFIVYT